jgi:hypothetical protein
MHRFIPTSLLLALALANPGHAEGPRPITPSEAASPTCFGFAADGAVYAVRKKASCEAAGKCEAATYLTRVQGGGFGKTVGYLTLLKKDVPPTDGELVASARTPSLAKAAEAMSDVVSPCSEAVPGSTLTLEGGRTVKVIREPGGRTVLRSDNFREVVISAQHEQILWGPEVRTWYARRTVTAPPPVDATATPPLPATDTEFFSFDVSRLFGPLPAPASSKAVTLTRQKLLEPLCLGVERASGAYHFNVPVVLSDRVTFNMLRVSPSGTETFQISSRMRLAAAPDPRNTANAVTDGELAFANERLAKVDAPCALAFPAPEGLPPTEIQAGLEGAGGQPITAGLVSTPNGKMLRLAGKFGSRRLVPAPAVLMILSAPGTPHIVVQTLGKESSYTSVSLEALAHEPMRFPLPAQLDQPVCVRASVPRIIDLERAPGRTDLVLRSIAPAGQIPPAPGAEVFVIATGPESATAEELLAKITDEQRIALAERFPVSSAACTIEPFKPTAELALVEDKGLWRLQNATHQYQFLLRSKPLWRLSWDRQVAWGFEDDNSRLAFEVERPHAWTLRPEPPEVAAKAPKLLKDAVPAIIPADRRCLAWDSKTRTAWIVRYQSTCPDAPADYLGHCEDEGLLTEVRKDGYFKRVTLVSGYEDWKHMFEHANTYLEKADLGCLAGLEMTIRGRTYLVGRDGHQATLTYDGVTKKVGRIEDPTEERPVSITTAFWHPEVDAIAIELDAVNATRYLWVDISKLK